MWRRRPSRPFATSTRALRQAGATMADVVRVRYILPDAGLWGEACWPVTRKWLGEVRPCGDDESWRGCRTPRMKIEIEVTARLPQGG